MGFVLLEFLFGYEHFCAIINTKYPVNIRINNGSDSTLPFVAGIIQCQTLLVTYSSSHSGNINGLKMYLKDST